MEGLKEINIEGDRIFLKKSFGLWRTVKPYRIDGKINWKNLLIGGSWFNLIVTAAIIAIIAVCFFNYANALNVANECLLRNAPIIQPNAFTILP